MSVAQHPAEATMRALTLTQPWATLVAIRAKRAETRSWRPASIPTPWPLLIHAAKTMPGWARALCEQEPFRGVLAAAGYHRVADLPRGAVVAVGLVLAVRPTIGAPDLVARSGVDSWTPTPHEPAFGDYTPGRFAWLLDQVTPLAAPVSARGAQGPWVWRADPADLPAVGGAP